MEDIVQVKINNSQYNSEETIAGITKSCKNLIYAATEAGFWSDSIKKIVITDELELEVEKQSQLWNIYTSLSKEKGQAVTSKILYNHNADDSECHIFFHLYTFIDNSASIITAFFNQVIYIYSDSIIPHDIKTLIYSNPSSFEDYIKIASIGWCRSYYTAHYMQNLDISRSEIIDHSNFLNSFKRKLKRNLFEYNNDKYDLNLRTSIFWHSYNDILNTFVLRLIEFKSNIPELMINKNDSIREFAYKIVLEVHNLTKRCTEGEDYNIDALVEAIKSFSAHYGILFKQGASSNFEIEFVKDPRDYFVDELVDTEPRIVCFMDILGFSDHINQYDSDETSTILQDIKESFDLAMNNLLRNDKHNNETVRHLKYQTFSDNICISIPYFDNEVNFITNFNLLCTYIRGFQLIMMSKGIFMRGGISVGSYYADENIIFSKGLVNAYYIESKKAIYPRVVIDNIIIDKLFKYNIHEIHSTGLDRIIIFDWENVAFLNPFGATEVAIQQVESAFKSLQNDNDDNDDDYSKLICSITQSLGDIAIEMLKSASDKEIDIITPIKSQVIYNLTLHYKNEKIVSKYMWLNEFIKWYEKDNNGKLKFLYMSEVMKN